jgi:hypothetical protein
MFFHFLQLKIYKCYRIMHIHFVLSGYDGWILLDIKFIIGYNEY